MKEKRLFLFQLALGVAVLLIVIRLFELQIILGKKNLAIAEGNRIRRVTLFAPRGMIFDRSGRELVRNIPVYRFCKLPEKRLINEPARSENCRLVDRDEALRWEAEGLAADEEIRLQVGRKYLFGPGLAPVLGYLDWELAGTTGIEGYYDDLLRGQNGGEIFEVDTQGVKIRQIDRVEAEAGGDLRLSLDAELSETAFEAFEKKPGALVATEAKTGQILALVSSPSFDPGIFTEVSRKTPAQDESFPTLREAEIDRLFKDPLKPMFNRSVGGVYPPGSTFKIITAAAGLEEGKIDGSTLIEDTGVIQIGDYSYRNWYFTRYGKTEGEINVVRAIQRSTDTFFYKVGEMTGAQTLARWAGAFGLGKKTGIDIEGEAEGLVPTPDWKLKAIGERWFLGNTYHLSIGQGDLLLTPLQVNMMTSVIANEGKLCRPKIAQNAAGRKQENPSGPDRGECSDLRLKPETLRLIKEGLVAACSPGGTSGIFMDLGSDQDRAGSKGVEVACKTGTAEFGPVKENGYRDTHAWFTAFAPANDPEIVVTAVVEGGGEGSAVAAPIVKKVMEAWFED